MSLDLVEGFQWNFTQTFFAWVCITIQGALYRLRQGPFSHMLTQDFLSRGALFFSQKVEVVIVMFKLTLHLHVQTSTPTTRHGKKIWQLIGAPWQQGPPPMVHLLVYIDLWRVINIWCRNVVAVDSRWSEMVLSLVTGDHFSGKTEYAAKLAKSHRNVREASGKNFVGENFYCYLHIWGHAIVYCIMDACYCLLWDW